MFSNRHLFFHLFQYIFFKDLPNIPAICPVILNQESHLLSNSDHFPTKSINIFGNSLSSNSEQDHDETNNSLPQPMSLIKPENAEQVIF